MIGQPYGRPALLICQSSECIRIHATKLAIVPSSVKGLGVVGGFWRNVDKFPLSSLLQLEGHIWNMTVGISAFLEHGQPATIIGCAKSKVETLPPPCSKCWIPNRMQPLEISTWKLGAGSGLVNGRYYLFPWAIPVAKIG